MVVPVSNDDFVLFRLSDNKEYKVSDFSDTPLRPLPGMFFFDAWRLEPSLTLESDGATDRPCVTDAQYTKDANGDLTAKLNSEKED